MVIETQNVHPVGHLDYRVDRRMTGWSEWNLMGRGWYKNVIENVIILLFIIIILLF